MTPQALDALKASIAKWEANLEHAKAGRFVDVVLGPYDCPLCQMFNNDDTYPPEACSGCPVKDYTGSTHCVETPYVAVRLAIDDIARPGEDRSTRGEIAASRADAVAKIQAEVDFLISLLSEGAK